MPLVVRRAGANLRQWPGRACGHAATARWHKAERDGMDKSRSGDITCCSGLVCGMAGNTEM